MAPVVSQPATPLVVQKTSGRNEFLEAIAAAQLFADSKHVVDCPLQRTWADVRDDWDALKIKGLSVESLKGFVAENFGQPGSDLKAVLPPGWHEAPPDWLGSVEEPGLQDLGVAVHGLWKTLCREVSPEVIENPDRHTLLPLPYPFIVPGDRFRECYNWDSYWIILGLLASDLIPAADLLVRNLLALVDRWGFVPNGARSYYTNRSQPPLLSAMVLAVWDATGDEALLKEALPRLITQHRYWTIGNKAVRVRARVAVDTAGSAPAVAGLPEAAGQRAAGGEGGAGAGAAEVFTLSRYHAKLYEPRPESFREDVLLVARAGLAGKAAARLYCDIASAAESGWDFSSRWFVGGNALENTRTTQIVPADLNAWLYRTERDIAAIAGQLGLSELRNEYNALALQRLRAINSLMWNAAGGCWQDLLLLSEQSDTDAAEIGAGEAAAPGHSQPAANASPPSSSAASDGVFAAFRARTAETAVKAPSTLHVVEQREGVYASNWVPLWCGVAASGCVTRGNDNSSSSSSSSDSVGEGNQAAAAVAGLLASGLIQDGGLLTSLYRSGQQWDAPNAWPPLVHMAVEGLAQSGAPGGDAAAMRLARSWLGANLAAWRKTGHMHEKYDGYVPGGVGGGGEYEPQVGFGWSNGVLLDLMRRYCVGAGREER